MRHWNWKTEGLTQCQAEKRDFVQDKLLPLLADVDKRIESVAYRVDADTGMEFVIIEWPDDVRETVNVSHDSLSALCKDVFKIF